MTHATPTALSPKTFTPSSNSVLGKARKHNWIGFGICTALVFAMSGFSWFVLIVVLLFAGLMEWIIRRQLNATRGGVRLDPEGLKADTLSGPTKQFTWSELQAVTVESIQSNRMLKFQLTPTAERPDGRSFWTGTNAAQPTLGLGPFEAADQERMLNAIHRWHSLARGEAGAPPALPNELVAEREFQEQLTALAPHTWATWVLVAINLLIWGFSLTQGGNFTGTPADKLLQWGGNATSEVQKGEWWRLLTSTFLHSGFMHVAMNMFGLYTAGTLVERIYGIRLYLIVYFGAGLLGSAFSLHYSAQQAVSVGASGAVFGVTGALLVAVLQHRDKLPKNFSKQLISGIGFFVVYSLLQGFTKPSIDNAAHIGGLVGGALAAFILPERFDLPTFQKVMLRRALTALVVMSAATMSIAAMAPSAPFDQARAVEGAHRLEHLLKDFEQAMKALAQEQEEVKAGQLSEQEADNRSRSVHAPVMRKIRDDLADIILRPGDPRAPLIRDMQRLSQLMTEGLEMESVFNPDTGKMEPANPKRAAEIETETLGIGERLMGVAEKAKTAKGGSERSEQ